MSNASFRLVIYEKSTKYYKTVKEEKKLKNNNFVWYYHQHSFLQYHQGSVHLF